MGLDESRRQPASGTDVDPLCAGLGPDGSGVVVDIPDLRSHARSGLTSHHEARIRVGWRRRGARNLHGLLHRGLHVSQEDGVLLGVTRRVPSSRARASLVPEKDPSVTSIALRPGWIPVLHPADPN